MGTVVEPPHPRDPVGTVGRAKMDSLPTPPPLPAGCAPCDASRAIDPIRFHHRPGFRFWVSGFPGSGHPIQPQNTRFRVEQTPRNPISALRNARFPGNPSV